jgi:hypothetical protein
LGIGGNAGNGGLTAASGPGGVFKLSIVPLSVVAPALPTRTLAPPLIFVAPIALIDKAAPDFTIIAPIELTVNAILHLIDVVVNALNPIDPEL